MEEVSQKPELIRDVHLEKKEGEIELVKEVSKERAIETPKEIPQEAPITPKTSVLTAPEVISSSKPELLGDIETILSRGLGDIFVSMDPESQQKFKEEGEKTALKIALLLQKAKVKAKEILSLIRRWLSMIPGINKFFLEQEAKIKADRILSLRI